jgi:hypothetical protein
MSVARIVGLGWLGLGLVFVTVLVILVAVFGIRWVTAEPRGKLQARERIQSGSFRIAAYDHFFNLCAGVQTDEATIRALRDELASDGITAARRGQVQVTLTALTLSRAEKVNQYNVDARKDYTVGQFRSSGLPYALDLSVEATTCAA